MARQGPGHVAITPRFAITSTPEQMEMPQQALVREHRDLHVQTHLSENHDEIAFTSLYPDAIDYTDIYARYGLLGPKDAARPRIHLSDRRFPTLSETGAVAVFCPTSNLFLGSGLFPTADRFDKPARAGRSRPMSAAGTSYSMLRTMDEAYKIQHLQGQRLSPLNSFYRMTLGNARALGLAGPHRHAACGHRCRYRRARFQRQIGHGTADAHGEIADRRAVHPADDGRRPLCGRGLCGGEGNEETA
jgi:guanine deaminase